MLLRLVLVGGIELERAQLSGRSAEHGARQGRAPVTSAFLTEKLSWITKLDFPAEPKDAEQPFFLEMEGSFASTSLRLH